MYGVLGSQGQTRSLKVYADWTERIAKGEVPPAPSRPTGIERNLVLTLWDVGDDHSFMQDLSSTDKNRPTVNPNGPIYGALEASADYMPVVDPIKHTATQIKLKVRDPKTPSEAETPPAKPSPYWG